MSKLTPAQEDAADRAERLMSMSKAAALMGRDRNTLAAWAAKGMPIARKGESGSSHLVDLKEVILWREEQVRREERTRFPGAGEDGLGEGMGGRMSPSDLLKLENLKLTRLKVGQAAEILVERSIPEMAEERAYGILRQAIMALPERLTREMAGFPEEKKLIWRQKAQGWCREALKQSAKVIADAMGTVPTRPDDAV
ncbi:hypothetical protein NS365_05505 [Aureimonas ureilytica]|uniref:Terminase small subunit n=1 Tax=Aureimonas ureilytica TaxID=401562 RepID=A0A175RTU2_9HYPH|nr:hypothetical protein [Aureimonas ureilytica]KTR06891.1 hypothetical protein NS365_05505 [Aureimonas ureilytica]